MPGRSRGGNAAGNFHPRPGPASRLPRTGRRPPRGPRRSGKTTGGGDERSTAGRRKANDLAFRARNARSHSGGLGRRHIYYFTRCRPSAPLPDCSQKGEFFDNSQTGNGAWQRRKLSCEVSAFRRLWHGAPGQARGMSSISAADPISESRDTSNYLILVSF